MKKKKLENWMWDHIDKAQKDGTAHIITFESGPGYLRLYINGKRKLKPRKRKPKSP